MKICLPGRKVAALGLCTLALVVAGSSLAVPGTTEAADQAPPTPSPTHSPRLPEMPFNYVNLDLPAHFKTAAARRFDNTPNNNPVTDAGATLGRVLFYDKNLSANRTVACASCHLQKNAFADPNRFSKGFEGKLVDRHAPGLSNLRFYRPGRFFWDERARTLEAQVLMPIQSKVEMGHTLDKLMEVLAKQEYYPKLYQQAFGSEKITTERTAKAMAQFLRSLVSYRSKYDEGLAKVKSVDDDFPNFTAQENRGKTVFQNRCATCHMPQGQSAHFFMTQPRNNGLDRDYKKTDGGVGAITLQADQLGLFKSPSLRNVELTGPYMHDGRFDTLEKVINHYARGVQQHPNLDRRTRRGNINPGQRTALVAFLKTLTDQQFIADPKYSDPFPVIANSAPGK